MLTSGAGTNLDSSSNFKNVGGPTVAADGNVVSDHHHSAKHAIHVPGVSMKQTHPNPSSIDPNDSKEFPSLSDAAKMSIHPDTDANRAMQHGDHQSVRQAATGFGGSHRGATEISGASHSHATGHTPDRNARLINHNDNPSEIAPLTESEQLAMQQQRQLDRGESDFVSRDITPEERAARERQSEEDKKYQQRHSTLPATADQYKLSEEELTALERDRAHHDMIDARRAVKHEVQREMKHLEKEKDKSVHTAADIKHDIKQDISYT